MLQLAAAGPPHGGPAHHLVGELDAVHRCQQVLQQGGQRLKARHLAGLDIRHHLCHRLLDGGQGRLHVGAAALVAQQRQEGPVGRDDRAGGQAGTGTARA